jgi:hypothetical protein
MSESIDAAKVMSENELRFVCSDIETESEDHAGLRKFFKIDRCISMIF